MPTLNFKGKEIVYSYHHNVAFKTILYNDNLSTAIGEKPQDHNYIFEGNNLEVMKSIIPNFAGKIKCIFAAPPFNTGSEGWFYQDEINAPLIRSWLKHSKSPISRDDPERHDKWLCMMWPRLKLMQELLAEDGVVFINIDDNELFNLKIMMDEIFQEDNFLATFIWEKRYGPPPDVKDIGYTHECILAYRKSISFTRNLLPATEEQLARYKNPDNDPRGPWKAMDYTCRYTNDERPNLYYPITHPKTKKKVWPKKTRVWAFSPKEHKRNEKEKRIWWGISLNSKVPAKKNFLSEIQEGRVPVTLLKYNEVGHTDEAAKELRCILPKTKFISKPVRLIEHLIKIAMDKNGIVLDPFAGAGSTAHAVLKLNKQDGGQRRYILIEDQETAKNITRERIFKICNGIKNANDRDLQKGYKSKFNYCSLGQEIDLKTILEGKNLPDFNSLAQYVFYNATGNILKTPIESKEEFFIGETQLYKFYLIYKPDKGFLSSKESALNIDFAKRIQILNVSNKKCLVWASSKYMNQAKLEAMNIEYCNFPFSIF